MEEVGSCAVLADPAVERLREVAVFLWGQAGRPEWTMDKRDMVGPG